MNNWNNHKTNEEVLEHNLKERLGQTGISKYGLPMTIVVYRNTHDIDINIDGTIVQHKNYRDFISGNIYKTSNDIKFVRIGETSVNSDGLTMTIIDYRKTNDIDIQFDDGTILYHKTYDSFKNGKCKNPNYVKTKIEKPKKEKIDKTGETNVAKNGMNMTIIAYRTRKDIDIQFEDGTIVTNKRYQHFLTGEINNPNVNKSNSNEKKNRVGETVNINGVICTIINYRNRKDIDVQLPNGLILEHRKYEKFKSGSIDVSSCIRESKLGETNTNKEGLNMTIVRYQNKNDIDIQFDDGTILKTYYNSFLDGTVKYPKKYLGETLEHHNGLMMTCTRYKDSSDIDVEFEDGYVVKNIEYRRFAEKNVRHPFPYMLGMCQIESRAYNYGEERNLFYICKNCHHHDIGTVEEIKNHICRTI